MRSQDARNKNAALELDGAQDAAVCAVLQCLQKGRLAPAKLAALEKDGRRVFRGAREVVFFRLKSCLARPANRGARVRWAEPEADNAREVRFSVEEVSLAPADLETEARVTRPRRKAESHDLGRKRESAPAEPRAGRKKNFSSKKEKLRREIAKYFYHSELAPPGKENVFHGQRRPKNVSKAAPKKRAPQERPREKFFYKKKLTQKKGRASSFAKEAPGAKESFEAKAPGGASPAGERRRKCVDSRGHLRRPLGRTRDQLLRRQLLTISSRAGPGQVRRGARRANSIQVLEEKRQRARKRIAAEEKKAVSISLKDNFIREAARKKGREAAPARSPFRAKGKAELGAFARAPEKLGQYHSNFSNLFERKRSSLLKPVEVKKEPAPSLPKGLPESLSAVKQKKAAQKQRKRGLEQLRLGKRPKKLRRSGPSGAGELRPYSAPIDGGPHQRKS